jgi:hypothetical protein
MGNVTGGQSVLARFDQVRAMIWRLLDPTP